MACLSYIWTAFCIFCFYSCLLDIQTCSCSVCADSGSSSDSIDSDQWRLPHSKLYSKDQELKPEQTFELLKQLSNLYKGSQDPAVLLREAKTSKLIRVKELSTNCDLESLKEDYKSFEQSYEIYPNIVNYIGTYLSQRLSYCIFASTRQQTFEPEETSEALKILEGVYIIWDFVKNLPKLREISELSQLNSRKPKGCELSDLNKIEQLVALRSDQANIVAYLNYCLRKITKYCLFGPIDCKNRLFMSSTVYKYLLAYEQCRSSELEIDDTHSDDAMELENVKKLIKLSLITDESCKDTQYSSTVIELLDYYRRNGRIVTYIKHRRGLQLLFCHQQELKLRHEETKESGDELASDSSGRSGGPPSRASSLERFMGQLVDDEASDERGVSPGEGANHGQDESQLGKEKKQKGLFNYGKFLPKCLKPQIVKD